jgi:calcium/calmodulin-dependent protein kinase I
LWNAGIHGARDLQKVGPWETRVGAPFFSLPSPDFTDQSHSDIWAIGVITYFLLCGYTPFDRDSNIEEMQAILVADYSFTPIEYWRNVSTTAREFIKRCLTIDPHARMTAHEALQHPWIADTDTAMSGEDLLPTVKKNFNARRTLHAAIDTIRAINQLRAGQGAAMMDGALSKNPERQQAQGGLGGGGLAGAVGMVMDSRGNAKGQTEEQIQEQERRIGETLRGLWNGRT